MTVRPGRQWSVWLLAALPAFLISLAIGAAPDAHPVRPAPAPGLSPTPLEICR